MSHQAPMTFHLSATICWYACRVRTGLKVTGCRFGFWWRCALHARSASCWLKEAALQHFPDRIDLGGAKTQRLI
jgi:hypothetical protein